MSKKTTFLKGKEKEFQFNPAPALYKFYQICQFKDPKTNKYSVRKFIINEKNEFVNVSTRKYTEAQAIEFFKTHRDNEYRAYATYDLDLVDYPNGGTIQALQSPLLNNNHNYYGFASVDF